MCAVTHLYRLDLAAADVARQFGASSGEDPWSGGQIAPGQFAPVITGGREFIAGPRGAPTKPRITPRIWGVPPPPKAHEPARGITHLRNPESPFWIGNLRNSEFRCIIPATAFMEWGNDTDYEGRRIQHWFAHCEGSLLAIAGVWKDSEIPGFAMLTCPANPALRKIGRDRMPVILPNDAESRQRWLNHDWRDAKALITPCPEVYLSDVDGPHPSRS